MKPESRNTTSRTNTQKHEASHRSCFQLRVFTLLDTTCIQDLGAINGFSSIGTVSVAVGGGKRENPIIRSREQKVTANRGWEWSSRDLSWGGIVWIPELLAKSKWSRCFSGSVPHFFNAPSAVRELSFAQFLQWEVGGLFLFFSFCLQEIWQKGKRWKFMS